MQVYQKTLNILKSAYKEEINVGIVQSKMTNLAYIWALCSRKGLLLPTELSYLIPCADINHLVEVDITRSTIFCEILFVRNICKNMCGFWYFT